MAGGFTLVDDMLPQTARRFDQSKAVRWRV